MKKILNLLKVFKKKRFLIPLVLVLLIIIISKVSGGNNIDSVVKVKIATFEKTVSVSGKVIPVEKVDLSFETSGTVQNINKVVGQKVLKGEIIASLNTSDLIAERQSIIADLEIEEAELFKLRENSSGSEVETKKIEAVNIIKDAYEKTDDAIRSKVDQFFDDPTDGPKIKYTFNDYFSTKPKLDAGRKSVEKILVTWKTLSDSLDYKNYDNTAIDKSIGYVTEVKNFLNQLSSAVNSFEESSSLSKSTIDGFRSDFSTGRTNVSTALSNLVSAKDSLRNSISNIPIYEAKVRSVEAKLQKVNAEISKAIIRAPFSGVISEKEIELGQSVPQNQKAFSLIGSALEIEAFIPEINLPGIAVGNKVTVKLDAYPDDEFVGAISNIDPAETEKDGVSNYKVKISFNEVDERIKSGMTADVWIVTAMRPDVLLIPLRAVTKEDGKDFVFVSKGKESVKTEVELGEADGKGSVEVLSGVRNDQELVLNQE